jgi:membrane protein
VFSELQDALNTIWEVKPVPGRSWLVRIKDRLLSFTMMMGINFLLLVSLLVSAGLTALGAFLGTLLPDSELVLQILNFLISFGVITLLFAMMYKIIPDVKLSWSDVWIGAAATGLLFSLGKFVIGLYLGTSTLSSAYGAAGSLVIILVWVYYSAQILFFGAEFTKVYTKRYGTQIVPAEYAVPVTEEARAQQGIVRQERIEAASQAE